MRKLFRILTVPLVAVLVACGGGGGDAGTTGSGGSGTGATTSQDTILTVVLKNPNDTSAESIAAGGGSVLESTLKTKAGKPVAGQIVTVYNSIFNDLVVYPSGVTATTDKDGKATVKISRSALDRYGSGPLKQDIIGYKNVSVKAVPYSRINKEYQKADIFDLSLS